MQRQSPCSIATFTYCETQYLAIEFRVKPLGFVRLGSSIFQAE